MLLSVFPLLDKMGKASLVIALAGLTSYTFLKGCFSLFYSSFLASRALYSNFLNAYKYRLDLFDFYYSNNRFPS